MRHLKFLPLLWLGLGGCTQGQSENIAQNTVSSPTPRPHETTLSQALLQTVEEEVRDVEFSPDAKWMAVGGRGEKDGTVTVYDCKTNRIVQSWAIANGVIFLSFSPEGSRLVIGGASGNLSVWDWPHKRCLHKVTLNSSNGRLPVAFTPDGRYLAAGPMAFSSLKPSTGSISRRCRLATPTTFLIP